MRLKVFICIVLAVVTLGLYWPARHFDFIYWDDLLFLNSPGVAQGVHLNSLKWAMTGVVAGNWHPLTNLSFAAMRYFYGYNPGAEHLLNVFIHAANAVLLFLVLAKLTTQLNRSILPHPAPLPLEEGESKSPRLAPRETWQASSPTIVWPCAVVAAIFAWHPQRVESVAWIAERKDVLFAFFMLLSLWCYARYSESEKRKADSGMPNGKGKRRDTYYGLALFFFALSLMSKAMSVTLPFLLLLLDFWPLGRLNRSTARRLVVEKIPFFVLTITFCAVTFWIQRSSAAVMPLNELGIMARIENAILSYVYYLGDFFWPARLSIYYQYVLAFDAGEVSLAGLLLLAVTLLCILEIRRRPYLAAGWVWYLGTMVPVIGLVQVGYNSMADRYTYLPLVGPTLSLVWLVSEWAKPGWTRNFAAAAAIIVVAACAVLTGRQLSYWQNSVTLFDRAAALSSQAIYPHLPIADGLAEQGRWREAATEYQVCLTLKVPPFQFMADLQLATALAHLGFPHEADNYLDAALKIDPNNDEILNDLAWSLATDPDAHYRNGARAVELAEKACQLTSYQQTYYIGNLAAAYAEAGRFDDAIATAQRAIAKAQREHEPELEQKNRELLKLYLAHKTYHE
jgi:tetratricopeptide (TPR) repeat protein